MKSSQAKCFNKFLNFNKNSENKILNFKLEVENNKLIFICVCLYTEHSFIMEVSHSNDFKFLSTINFNDISPIIEISKESELKIVINQYKNQQVLSFNSCNKHKTQNESIYSCSTICFYNNSQYDDTCLPDFKYYCYVNEAYIDLILINEFYYKPKMIYFLLEESSKRIAYYLDNEYLNQFALKIFGHANLCADKNLIDYKYSKFHYHILIKIIQYLNNMIRINTLILIYFNLITNRVL